MRAWRVGALTVLIGLLAVEGTAEAEDGAAAILPFKGPQAVKIRQRVQSGLRAAEVQLIPLKRVTAVVRKTKGYAKQAAKLEASVLVGGRIRRSGERWIADIGLRNDDGVRVEKFRASSSSITRLTKRIVAGLLDTGMMPMVGDAEEGIQKLGPAEAVTAPELTQKPEVPRLVIRSFKGAQASKIRAAAVRGLWRKPVDLVPNNQFVQKAQSLNADLKSDRGHILPAKAIGVNGLLEGDVQLEDGVWSAYVRLVDGESADVISQHFYEGNSSAALARAVQAELWEDFRRDIKRLEPRAPVAVAAAPAAEPTRRDRKAEEEEAEAKAAAKKKRLKKDRPAAVDIEFDFIFVHRNLSWNEDQVGNLRDYTLAFGPGIQTKFQYFPGAHFTSGIGAQFGIDFEWQWLFDFDSTRDDGISFPTEAQQFLVGARWRYPTGRWEPTIIANYGIHKFEFGVSAPPVTTAGIPGVKYEFVRAGAGFRVAAGKDENFIVVVNGAYRYLLSAGGIQSTQWFPEANGHGMDALVMFAYGLPKGFEVRLGLDYRRYWFDLNPVPPDPPYVAGGALDQYWGLSIGAAWRY